VLPENTTQIALQEGPGSPSVDANACTDERCRSDRRLEESFEPIDFDDPAWDDEDTWVLGPAIPPDATFYLAGRAVRDE
jgi:hypothetical protein